MAPKIKFAENEKVLCFHGPLLYEAKCMKNEIGKDRTIRYYIHYNGWKKHWDEWVQESRVLKYNEASLTKQRELYKAHLASKKTKVPKRDRDKTAVIKAKPSPKPAKPTVDKTPQEKPKEKAKTPVVSNERSTKLGTDKSAKPLSQERGRSSTAVERAKFAAEKRTTATVEKPKSSLSTNDKTAKQITSDRSKSKTSSVSTSVSSASDNSRASAGTPTTDLQKRKRARLDVTIESEETFVTKVEVKVEIPEKLKPWLVDDWDLVTRQKNLVSVPCQKNVDSILKDYVTYKSKTLADLDAVKEVTSGIKEYFNVIFGTQLLFKFERPQYGEILSDYPNRTMSSLYGSAHLLRLFVRLGGMLVYTSLDDKSMPTLLQHIHEFLDYLSENFSLLFRREDYVIAPPEYHRKAI